MVQRCLRNCQPPEHAEELKSLDFCLAPIDFQAERPCVRQGHVVRSIIILNHCSPDVLLQRLKDEVHSQELKQEIGELVISMQCVTGGKPFEGNCKQSDIYE